MNIIRTDGVVEKATDEQIEKLLEQGVIEKCHGCSASSVERVYHLSFVFGDAPVAASINADQEWAKVFLVTRVQ